MWTRTFTCQQHPSRRQSNQELQVGIPGIWSLVNLALIVFKRPVHPGAHIALDFIFTIVLLFFGIVSLIAEQVSLYGERSSLHSSWHMAVAAFALMVING
jgi:hypothetical protein